MQLHEVGVGHEPESFFDDSKGILDGAFTTFKEVFDIGLDELPDLLVGIFDDRTEMS